MTQGTGPRPFHQVFRAAVRERGLTLEAIQRRLAERGVRVGRSTLSYWQNGHRSPTGASSFEVIAALEHILQIPTGTLRDTLMDLPLAPREPALDMATDAKVIDRLIKAVGCQDALRAFEPIGLVDLLTMGPDGSIELTWSLYVLRALADSDRYPVIYTGEKGQDVELIHHEPVSGCRIGRVERYAEGNVMVSELLMDRTVRRGETHLVQFRAYDENVGVPCLEVVKLLPTSTSMVATEVTFHPAMLPVHIEEFEKATEGGPDLLTRRRMVTADGRVSVIRERGRRGLLGLRWSYP
jgi:transcriptional regulator with XRE-family HTH domain